MQETAADEVHPFAPWGRQSAERGIEGKHIGDLSKGDIFLCMFMENPMAKILDWDARIGGRVRLRDLHILLAVVQCGSMAKAAAQLRVSQPAVSEAIAGLERALDVRLLDRGRRGVEPTAYGSALLKSGRAAFDELRQGIKQIEFLSDPAAGELRIACPESISSGILGPIIKRMSERYPRVRLFVEPFLFSGRPLFPQLENREVDLVFTRSSTPPTQKDFAVEILFNDRIRLAAGKHGPWARRRKIDLAELVGEPWITVPSDDIGGAVLLDAFRARGLEPPRITVTTYSIHLRNSLAANARFIAALPDSVLRFNTDNLRQLPINLPEPPWSVAIVTPKKQNSNPVVQRFIDCARELAKSITGEARRPEPHVA
jgi:DNA-binding transcriptional LysR family regulator